jgi:hypothetical protein
VFILLNTNMFMVKQLLNMNKKKSMMYPKAGRETESPDASLFSGLTIWLTVGEPQSV